MDFASYADAYTGGGGTGGAGGYMDFSQWIPGGDETEDTAAAEEEDVV